MWRVGSMLGATKSSTHSLDHDEEAGATSAQMGGVMVCGGAPVCDFEDDKARTRPLTASPARRAITIGQQLSPNTRSILPTLPARRALLNGEHNFVDNTQCVGAAHAIAGSHFGVAKTQAPLEASVTASADLLSNYKPVAAYTHLDVRPVLRPLAQLAGLSEGLQDKTERANSTASSKQWRAPYRLPKTPGCSEGGGSGKKVLAPASLSSLCSPKCPQALAPPAQNDDDDECGGSCPTSDSFCSSNCSEDGTDSDDGTGSEHDSAAGVFGQSAAANQRPGGGDEPSSAAAQPGEFCLGIRWFIRNNKLVVGSFSGWSVADKMGVKHGDILRAVDGAEVLNLVADEDGNHPAKQMLKGVYGSKCTLHLMRVDVGQVRDMMRRPGSAAGKEKLVLHDIHVHIPRLIAADI